MILAVILSGLSVFCSHAFQTNANTYIRSYSHSNIYQQPVDSLAFHLYTDSLKKSIHNYINVDGLLSNGKWIPLGTSDIHFTSTGGVFEGNNLIIPGNFTGSSVTITATYNRNNKLRISTTVYLKIRNEEALLSLPEVKKEERPSNGRRPKKKKGS